MEPLILIGGVIFAFFVALLLSRREGSKAAQLEALKKELKQRAEEQERAQKITDNVNNMPSNDVRDRLQNLPNQQR